MTFQEHAQVHVLNNKMKSIVGVCVLIYGYEMLPRDKEADYIITLGVD